MSVYIISVSSSVFRVTKLSDPPAFYTITEDSTPSFHPHTHHRNLPTFLSLFRMSFNYYHNDPETSESFETLRILDRDDSEDSESAVGPVTEPDGPRFDFHAGLGGGHHMPVSLPCLIQSRSLLAKRYHPRCRASDAHVVPRGALSSGCSLASIALVAINPARL